jgi:alanine racemase
MKDKFTAESHWVKLYSPLSRLRPAWVEIDLRLMEENLQLIRNHIGKKIKIIPVVKADAYGHGIIPVSRKLESLDVTMLGVSFLDEGLALRQEGITMPILVMSGFNNEQAHLLAENRLTPAIFNLHMAQDLARKAAELDTVLPYHLKVDTGLGRFGVHYEQAVELAKKLQGIKGIWLEGIFSHLSFEPPGNEFNNTQIKRFQSIILQLKEMGINPPLLHMANSAGVIAYPESWFNCVRPGTIVSGNLPAGCSFPVKPILSFKTRIVLLREFAPHTPVSYEASFITQRDSTIAFLPVGYSDGFNRLLSDGGEVLIRGRRVPIAGKICMNFTLIDVTDLPKVEIGDEVVIIGESGAENITAMDLAKKLRTLPEEVLLRIDKGLDRVYIE